MKYNLIKNKKMVSGMAQNVTQYICHLNIFYIPGKYKVPHHMNWIAR